MRRNPQSQRLHFAGAAGRSAFFDNTLISTVGLGPVKILTMSKVVAENLPDAQGHFGPYGGRFVPETLMHPLQELEAEYFRAQHDPEFQRELQYYLREFCGRPTPLYLAERLTRERGRAKIYPTAEDLLHTGAHKTHNSIGQIL